MNWKDCRSIKLHEKQIIINLSYIETDVDKVQNSSKTGRNPIRKKETQRDAHESKSNRATVAERIKKGQIVIHEEQ